MAGAAGARRAPTPPPGHASPCDCTKGAETVTLRFYAELNDFLAPLDRGHPLTFSFYTPVPVKDAIEGLGVPHTEVDLILVNGESVDFSHLLRDGDRVSVYPVFESIDISPVLRVRPKPLREIRFLADTHLGRLAAYLRLMGFDTVYGHNAGDRDLAQRASEERRILLTRDRGLLMRSAVTHGYWLRQTNPRLQLREVLERFDLASSVAPFTRCLRCNTPLTAASKQEVAGRLPPGIEQQYEEFQLCLGCGRIYWEGSHHRRMSDLVAATLSPRPEAVPPPRPSAGGPTPAGHCAELRRLRSGRAG